MPKRGRASQGGQDESMKVTFHVHDDCLPLQKYRAKLLKKAGIQHEVRDDAIAMGPFEVLRSREARAASSGAGDPPPPDGWDSKCWKDFLAMSGGASGLAQVAAGSLPAAVPESLHRAFGCIVSAQGDSPMTGIEQLHALRTGLQSHLQKEVKKQQPYLQDALEEVEAALQEALRHRRRSEPLSEKHRKVHVLKQVMLHDGCSTAISQAEEHASKTGGWTTRRHREYPTTDVCTSDIPSLHKKLEEMVKKKILPRVAEKFQLEEAKLSFHDMFVAKYTAELAASSCKPSRKRKAAAMKKPAAAESVNPDIQSGLDEHEDGTPFSFVVGLNDLSEFDGGGTRFVNLAGLRTFRESPGDAVIFSGYNRHCGVPITRGIRYILAGFLAYDEL